jgi:Methyltransferase domain
MNLTNPQRILKLATTLMRQPLYLPDYCRYHLYRGKLPVDLGLPWWSFGAIEAVREWCSGSVEAFEYGSGGSTVFLSRLCQSVTAVEDDAEWLARMRAEIDRAELRNVTLHLAPFDFLKPVAFEESSYLHALDRTYDLIVVDGQDWTYDVRPACFRRAEQFIRPGGVIVVDDSWRYGQLRTASRARDVKTFEGVGPCRVGVTSTDLYYY